MTQLLLTTLNKFIDDYCDQRQLSLEELAVDEMLAAFSTQFPAFDTTDTLAIFQSFESIDSAIPHLITSIEDSHVFEPGMVLNQYRIVRLLGEGGMGEVYLAERADGQYEKKVALKVLSKGWVNEQVIQRFWQERQILASLNHPNIAVLHDAGVTENNRPWLVIDYIDGLSIDEFCQTNNASVESILKLMIDICKGVAYAHQNGVIHRDLKPNNIMVIEESGTVTPVILDFGIAAQANNKLVTQTGQAIGTVGYMSPEQTTGNIRVSPSSDVFSLGVILYELLSKQHPFKAESATETNHQVINAIPKSLTRYHINPNLAAVVDKCLAKNANQRYSTASALAADLIAYLAGQSVTARPLTKTQKLNLMMRRHPIRSLLFGLLLVSILVFSGLLIKQQIKSKQHATAVQYYSLLSKDIEQSIHNQHLLPAHDLSPEYAAMEASIVRLINDQGMTDTAAGPIYATLGQAYQLLNQPKKAIDAFERASQLGFLTSRSEEQYGLALALAWEHEQARIVQLADEENRKQATAAANQNYLSPALQKLSQSTSDQSNGIYLKAYLSYLNKDYEQATIYALQAYELNKTLYEAQRLAGLASLHLGKDYGIQGDAEQATQAYDQAEIYLLNAANLARSDLKTYHYLCDLSDIKLHSYVISDRPLNEALFQGAIEICQTADTLKPDELTVLVNQLEIYDRWSNWLLDLGQPVYQVAEKHYQLAQKAFKLKPQDTDVITGMVLSIIKITEPDNHNLSKAEKYTYLQQAKQHANQGLKINNQDAYNWANLGDVELTIATHNYNEEDVLNNLDSAIEAYQKADIFLPSYAWIYMQGECHRAAADYLLKTEQYASAKSRLAMAQKDYQTALDQTPEFATAWKNLAMVLFESIKLNQPTSSDVNKQQIEQLETVLVKNCQLYQNKGGFPAVLQPILNYYEQLGFSKPQGCP